MTGGQVMSNPKRTLGLLGVLALTISACSSGGSASSAPASAAAERGSAAAPPHPPPPSAAAEPVTIDWWHITTGDPGKADFQAIADAYTAAHPNVKIKITVLENEAFKTKLATPPRPDAVPGPVPVVGRRRPWPPRPTPALLKDITADVAPWKDTINPGAMSIYQYNGKQYGIPWDMGMIGFWYNKDALREGRDHRPADHVGRVPGRRRRSSRRPASPRSPSRARTSGRRCTSGPTCCSASAAATRSAR